MLDSQTTITILALQLLIARAAQKDSLSWWEDDSLTPSGKYLLERLFMVDPDEVGRRLALEAARVRYRAAFGEDRKALHLFRLDQTGEVEFDLREVNLSTIPLSSAAIQTIDSLRRLLLEQVGSPMSYEVVGERFSNRWEIKLKDKSLKPDLVQIVKTLAWATLEGEPGKPVFPYIRHT